MINIPQEEIIKTWGNFDIEKPLVSVRCMTFNQEKYISQALDGFLMQKTTFPFEVVVHDDVSSDSTADIIREYEKKYPLIIKPIYETENQYSKHDGSITRIMNQVMKGKYVAFCEGDDYWIDENKLQMQVDFLENNLDYSMCFHGATVIKEIETANFSYIEIGDRDYTPTELFANWIVPTASMVMKKECLDIKVKNATDFLYGDIKIIENCAHKGKVYGFSKKMSVYRIQQTGVTWNKDLDEKRFRKSPRHFITIKNNYPLIKRSAVNYKIVESYLLCIIKCGNVFEKITWGWLAFTTSPIALIKNIIEYIKRKIK
ncbi:MAG: glycosyltransferase [Treponema sp.]|nr:glycosyltransferase [Treponema sp.]